MWPTLGNAKFGHITEVAASGGKLSITIQGLIIQVASAYEGWSLVRVVQFLTLRFYSVHPATKRCTLGAGRTLNFEHRGRIHRDHQH